LNKHSAQKQISRRSWLIAGLTAPLFFARGANALTVTFDGDNLHVLAPELHFLTGKPLTRLRDGGTVVFLSQLTLLHEDRVSVFRRVPERLTVSYDVWEEKFSVLMGVDRRSVSRLTAAAAESWCLDNLAISALGMAPDRPFWLQFDLRVADPREISSVVGDSISLTNLIEVLSRKPRTDDGHWSLEAGPFRLADLTRISGRRTRNG
jgi:hypothetical protein